jgi:hypothetical protein
MVNIKERNSSNVFVYVLILLFGTFIVWNEYHRNRSNLEAFLLSCGFLLILFGLFLKEVEISIGKSFLAIKFKLLGITYKSIKINFEHVELEGALTFSLRFISKQEEILKITLDTDLEKYEKDFLMLEVFYKNKTYRIGNRANAKKLFERIKNACLT